MSSCIPLCLGLLCNNLWFKKQSRNCPWLECPPEKFILLHRIKGGSMWSKHSMRTYGIKVVLHFAVLKVTSLVCFFLWPCIFSSPSLRAQRLLRNLNCAHVASLLQIKQSCTDTCERLGHVAKKFSTTAADCHNVIFMSFDQKGSTTSLKGQPAVSV